METITQREADMRKEIGKMDIPTRYFISAYITNEYNEPIIDHVEATESEFLQADGDIHYERHTIHMNGVAQICLTKTGD